MIIRIMFQLIRDLVRMGHTVIWPKHIKLNVGEYSSPIAKLESNDYVLHFGCLLRCLNTFLQTRHFAMKYFGWPGTFMRSTRSPQCHPIMLRRTFAVRCGNA